MLKVTVPSCKISYDKKRTSQVLRSAASEVARVARQLIRGGGSGPSAPGQPPHSQTGLLARSIHTSVRAARIGNAVVARVFDTASDPKGRPYSKFLETGAFGGGGAGLGRFRSHKRQTAEQRKAAASSSREMAPRPYLTRALEQRQASIADRIKAAVLQDMAFEKIK